MSWERLVVKFITSQENLQDAKCLVDSFSEKICLLDFSQGMQFHVIIYQNGIEKRKYHLWGIGG